MNTCVAASMIAGACVLDGLFHAYWQRDAFGSPAISSYWSRQFICDSLLQLDTAGLARAFFARAVVRIGWVLGLAPDRSKRSTSSIV